MMGNYTEMNTNKIKVKYISDIKSIFFEREKVYEAYILNDYPKLKAFAFYFSEQEIDEEGYFVLPSDRFEIVQ